MKQLSRILDRIIELYDISGGKGGRCQIVTADLSFSVVRDQTLICCDWVNCDLSSVVFEDCDLRWSDFSRSKLEGTTFRGCLLEGCEFPTSSGTSPRERCQELVQHTQRTSQREFVREIEQAPRFQYPRPAVATILALLAHISLLFVLFKLS